MKKKSNVERLVTAIERSLEKYGDNQSWRLFISVIKEQDERLKRIEDKLDEKEE